MPYLLSRLDNGKGVLQVGVGTVTDDEYFSVTEAHFDEPQDEFEMLYYSLIDLTDVEAIAVSTETIKEAARLGRANFHLTNASGAARTSS